METHNEPNQAVLQAETSRAITSEAVHVPPQEQVVQWISDIDALVRSLGSYAQALSAAQRRREAKIRRGGERHMPMIAETAARYGLSFPGGPGQIEANLETVAALTPVLMRLRAATEVVSDTILRARGAAWRGSTTAYTMLSRMAKNTPSIATDLQEATYFFARRYKGPPPGNEAAAPNQEALPTTPPAASNG